MRSGDREAFPEAGEVARDQAGEDGQPRAAFGGGIDDLMAVRALGAGEDAGQFRDDRRGERAATDDRRELPPEVAESWRAA